MTAITVLDDYQGVVLNVADWSPLGPDTEIRPIREHIEDEAELAGRISDSEVLVLNRERTRVSGGLLAKCPALKLLVTLGMRNPVIDAAAAKERGVTVCGTRMLAHPPAELTWGLIIGLARAIPTSDAAVREGAWQSGPLGFDLNGATLGVAGFGRVGKAVARIGVAFGMEVLVHSRTGTPEAAADIGARAVSKDDLLGQSDVLTLHIPGGPATRGFIGAAELLACKPGVRIVNTSRGTVVDTSALVDALHSGRVAGAAVDVFDEEPLPPDSSLRSAPNLVLTPHLGYVTERNYASAFAEVIEDIVAWRSGIPIRVIEG